MSYCKIPQHLKMKLWVKCTFLAQAKKTFPKFDVVSFFVFISIGMFFPGKTIRIHMHTLDIACQWSNARQATSHIRQSFCCPLDDLVGQHLFIPCGDYAFCQPTSKRNDKRWCFFKYSSFCWPTKRALPRIKSKKRCWGLFSEGRTGVLARRPLAIPRSLFVTQNATK